MKYVRSWVAITPLMARGASPWAPSMTILSMVIFRPSTIRNTTVTSPSGRRSTSGVIWASKYPSSS